MSETPFPVSAPPPDAASLAALLQSAAQALLRSGTSSEEHPAPAKVERIQEEIRHYRFPPLAVRCEKELLEAEDAEEMEGVVMHTLARELRRIGRLVFKIQDAYSTVELVEA